MKNGWIKLWGKILENPVLHGSPHRIAVWIYLLLNVTREYEQRKEIIDGRQKKLEVGEMTCGREEIAKFTGVSGSGVQKILKIFEKEQMLEQQTYSKFRLIRVMKFNSYQKKEQVVEQQSNNRETTEKQQSNTTYIEDIRRVKKNIEDLATPPPPLKPNIEPLTIFTIGKSVTNAVSFQNSQQLFQWIKRNIRASKDLVGYSPEEIVRAYLYAVYESEDGRKYDVTLETVGKKIAEHKLDAVTGKYQKWYQEILDIFHKDNGNTMLSKSSPLIRVRTPETMA